MTAQTNTIAAGEFKAKCLRIMDEVSKNNKPIDESKPVDYFGCLKDSVTIEGDIVFPTDVKWEANED